MNISKPKLYLIIFLLLGLVFAGVFAYRNFHKNIIITQPPKVEFKDDLNNFNQAQEAKNVDSCLQIKDLTSKDFCIEELAVKTQTTSTCATLSTSDIQNNCVAKVSFNTIITSNNIADCQKIDQSMLAKACVETIAASDKTAKCDLIADQSLRDGCFSVIYYQQAKNTNSADLCNKIPELIRRANCLSELQHIDLHSDADKDGLDFVQEILNGTDPNKADTDGDGHNDGVEIKGGFNPDGPGNLVISGTPNLILCKDIKDTEIQAICSQELPDKILDLFKCKDIKDPKLKAFCSTSLLALQK